MTVQRCRWVAWPRGDWRGRAAGYVPVNLDAEPRPAVPRRVDACVQAGPGGLVRGARDQASRGGAHAAGQQHCRHCSRQRRSWGVRATHVVRCVGVLMSGVGAARRVVMGPVNHSPPAGVW